MKAENPLLVERTMKFNLGRSNRRTRLPMPAHYLTNTESTIFRYWRKSSW
jgi:hypothetical protein